MPITLRLDPALEERYNNLAALTGRSKSFYLREALENEIDNLEFIYDVQRISEEIRSGKQETYSIEEVREELGL